MDNTMQSTIQTQFFTNETITKDEFDARLAVDPNYPQIVHLQGFRLLVVIPDYGDVVNRASADVVLYLSGGLAYVECSKFGPPGQTYPTQYINVYEILRASKEDCGACLPGAGIACRCKGPFLCNTCCTFSGINICGTCRCRCRCDCNPHLPNQDNIYSNEAFLNRK